MRITPNKERRPTLLAFAAWFLVTFVVLLAAWGYITPIYNYMVTSVASPIFNIVESDNVTVVRADQGDLLVGRHIEDGSIRPFLYFDPYIYFGIIPLIALLIAVPKPSFLRRLQLVAFGLGILFIVHVIYVVGSIELTYVAVGLQEVSAFGKRILDWTQVLLRILWQAAPILIFIMLSASFWRHQLSGKDKKETVSNQVSYHKLKLTKQVQGERP